MNVREVNRRVINLLKHLTDDREVEVRQRTHIKVSGLIQGKKTVLLTLSSSPTSTRYLPKVRSNLRRIVRTLDVDKETIKFIQKKFIHF